MYEFIQRARLLILPLLLLIAAVLAFSQFDSARAQRDDLIPESDRRADLTTTKRPFWLISVNRIRICRHSVRFPVSAAWLIFITVKNIDLLVIHALSSIGGGSGNDVWGWTSPEGREIALMGRSSGTAFVDVSDPVNPVYLGNLPTHSSNSSWRDIKTYADHAFIVSEAGGQRHAGI